MGFSSLNPRPPAPPGRPFMPAFLGQRNDSDQDYKPGPGSEMTLFSLQYAIRRCTFETDQDQVYRSALSPQLVQSRLTTDEMLPS